MRYSCSSDSLASCSLLFPITAALLTCCCLVQSVRHRNDASVDVELFAVGGPPAEPPHVPLGPVQRPRRAGPRPARSTAAPPPCRRGRRPWGTALGPRGLDGEARQMAAERLEPREPVHRRSLLRRRHHRCVPLCFAAFSCTMYRNV